MLVLRQATVPKAVWYAAAEDEKKAPQRVHIAQCEIVMNAPGWNALLIPVPTQRGTQPRQVDVSNAPHILDDMVIGTLFARLNIYWEAPPAIDHLPVQTLIVPSLSPRAIQDWGAIPDLTSDDLAEIEKIAAVYRDHSFVFVAFYHPGGVQVTVPVLYTYQPLRRHRRQISVPGSANDALQQGPNGQPVNTRYTLVARPRTGTRVTYKDQLSPEQNKLLPTHVWTTTTLPEVMTSRKDFTFNPRCQEEGYRRDPSALRGLHYMKFTRLLADY